MDTQDANKNWSWVTGEAWNYTNWSGGEPNDAYGPGSEQYLAMWANGGWNDEGNTSFITGYVAEKASTSAPEPSTILTLISGLLGLPGFRKKFAK